MSNASALLWTQSTSPPPTPGIGRAYAGVRPDLGLLNPRLFTPPVATAGRRVTEMGLLGTNRVEVIFRKLLAEWTRDTIMVSDMVTVLMHPAHYGIIGLGHQALPHIFKDLAGGGGPWYVALQAITQENPVEVRHANNAKLMREDWLVWGKSHGYIGA